MIRINKKYFLLAVSALCFIFISVVQMTNRSEKENKPKPEALSFKLDCLTKGVIQSSLSQKSIVPAVNHCSVELRSKLKKIDPTLVGNDIDEVILAMVVAHNAAPYGGSNAISYEDIIKSKQLNCGNQTILVGYLLPGKKIRFLGFDGGVVGNHLQLIYEKDEFSLLLDPTASIVTKISFNSLLQGKPANNVIVIHPNSENDPWINGYFTDKISAALLNGSYRPMDLLFYYEGVEHLLGKGPKDRFITPAGVFWREKQQAG